MYLLLQGSGTRNAPEHVLPDQWYVVHGGIQQVPGRYVYITVLPYITVEGI